MIIETAMSQLSSTVIVGNTLSLPNGPLIGSEWFDSLAPATLSKMLATKCSRDLLPLTRGMQKTYQILGNYLTPEQIDQVRERLAIVQDLADLSQRNVARLQLSLTLKSGEGIPIDRRYRGRSQEIEIIGLTAPFLHEEPAQKPPLIDYQIPESAQQLSRWVNGTTTEELLQRLTALSGEAQMLAKQLNPTKSGYLNALLSTGKLLATEYCSRLRKLQYMTDESAPDLNG